MVFIPGILDTLPISNISNPSISNFFSLLSKDLLALRDNAYHINCKDDEARLVLVDVYPRIRFECVGDNAGELHVYRAEPIFPALPKTVQGLF